MSQRPVRLTVNVHASGRHDAAWKGFDDPARLPTDIDHFLDIARVSERGLLDALFLADSFGGLTEEAYVRPWRALDPIALHAALSQATKHIGLIATTSSLFGHPSVVARQIASLDHISKGRAAWNVITSQHPSALGAFGFEAQFDHDTRYERAEEFVSIVAALWDSLPRDAILADRKSHVYVDRTRLREVDVRGRHFTVRGALGVPQSPQGRPVIVQAGTSVESRNLGAKWADILFIGQRTLSSAREFYDDVKGRARGFGRDPEQLLVMPGLFPIIGGTQEEARRRKDALDAQLDIPKLLNDLATRLGIAPDEIDLEGALPYALIEKADVEGNLARRHRDQLVSEARQKGLSARQVLYNNLTGGHRVVVGTPEQIADDIVNWVDGRAADGFQLNTDVQTEGLENFVNQVVPLLQKRGRFRTEYAGRTLRENLGLTTKQPALLTA
ncbi:MAG: NtaA/DmoA family FMN-dependent monooxygenase [Sphingobium sp.]